MKLKLLLLIGLLLIVACNTETAEEKEKEPLAENCIEKAEKRPKELISIYNKTVCNDDNTTCEIINYKNSSITILTDTYYDLEIVRICDGKEVKQNV